MKRLALLLALTTIVWAEPQLLVAEGGQIHRLDANHRWQQSWPLETRAKLRGICASTSRVYVSAGEEVLALDLASGKVVWRSKLAANPADRLDLSEDGRWLYVPSGFAQNTGQLYKLDAATGETVKVFEQGMPGRAHNCLVRGNTVYLAGRAGRQLVSLDQATGQARSVGPFSDFIRPFCLSSDKVYVNVDHLLGFEVGDLKTGKVLASVHPPEAPFRHFPHHECPSHGLGLSPDGREVWVVDSEGDRLLIFSTEQPGYPLLTTIDTGYDPGWVNFSLDGRWAYPSTGEIVDALSKRRVGWLLNGDGKLLQSEKILPIDWQDGRVVQVGKQYANGPKS